MKIQSSHIILFGILSSFFNSFSQEIPLEKLNVDLSPNQSLYSKILLENEIKGIIVKQLSITNKTLEEQLDGGSKFVYLFVKGTGIVSIKENTYPVVPESILLPNAFKNLSIQPTKNDTLHFLRIESKLTEQDILDLEAFPTKNIDKVYFKKFTDCEAYTEPIKSPNTVSRTILPNKYIPRIAMGTVQTTGPDKVSAHEHGMLEQLFLGLNKNNVTVFADDARIKFPEYSLLHIPLGSNHSVTVDKNETMYYVWMDFFRDKKGEVWLETHNTLSE